MIKFLKNKIFIIFVVSLIFLNNSIIVISKKHNNAKLNESFIKLDKKVKEINRIDKEIKETNEQIAKLEKHIKYYVKLIRNYLKILYENNTLEFLSFENLESFLTSKEYIFLLNKYNLKNLKYLYKRYNDLKSKKNKLKNIKKTEEKKINNLKKLYRNLIIKYEKSKNKKNIKNKYIRNKNYTLNKNALNKFKGSIMFEGHRETYYSQRILPGRMLKIPGRHVHSDGTIRDKDNYICLASNKPKGTLINTSLGMGKVYDYCRVKNTIDLYTDW